MEKKKGGRPKYNPTEHERRQVTAMSGYGMTNEQIADILGISAPTLAKHFSAELEKGLSHATLRITKTLFEQATDPEKPNMTAMIFWLKAKAGWRDKEPAPANGYVRKEDEAKNKAEDATKNGFFAVPKLKAVK